MQKGLASGSCGKINVISNYPTQFTQAYRYTKPAGKKMAKTQDELTQIKLPFLHPALFSFLTVNKARLQLRGEALSLVGSYRLSPRCLGLFSTTIRVKTYARDPKPSSRNGKSI